MASATRLAGPGPAGVNTWAESGSACGVRAKDRPGWTDHPPAGSARGSPSHRTRPTPSVLGWPMKARGCSTPWEGRSQRPPAAAAATGTRPSATKTRAETPATWRHPNSRPLRSFSKAAIPSPTQAATASAAGASTTDSEGAKDPRSPRVVANARPHDAQAVTHSRAAQRSRAPRPITRGSAAATTRSHTTGERAAGPMAKRSTSPQSGAVATAIGNPKIATEPVPASAVPSTQGAASSSATPTPSAATTSTRPAESRAPTRTEPTAQASAITTTSGTIAGAKPEAAAMTAPRMVIWPVGLLRHRGPRSRPRGGPCRRPGPTAVR